MTEQIVSQHIASAEDTVKTDMSIKEAVTLSVKDSYLISKRPIEF